MVLATIVTTGSISLSLAEFGAAEAAPASALTYEKDIRPVLKAHCFQCHGEAGERKGELDLRLRRFMVKGGKSGAGLVPGDHEGSLIYKRVHLEEMPPGEKKLSRNEISLIGKWILGGAKTARPEPETVDDGVLITEEERNFWSFQSVRRPDLPAVKKGDRLRTPVDAFLLARLEEKSLSFSPDADRQTFIRRVFFDLLGLPPSPADIEQFIADESPDAYEQLIDCLLASPRYGERWGRHWLDIAGYADSEGYNNADALRSFSFKYRDYVIRAFNSDKPFDQFVQEQLAGDEMVKPPYTPPHLSPEDQDRLIATGFLRMAADGSDSGGVDQDIASNATMADTIKIVSTSLQGLSVGCAQCHDHRYDPISQEDYYRQRAIFEPALNWKQWRKPSERRISLYTDEDRKRASELDAEVAKVEAERSKKQQEFIDQVFEKELAKVPEEIRESVRAARLADAKERTPEQERLLMDYPSVNVSAGSLYLYDNTLASELGKYSQRASEMRARKPFEDKIRALTEVPGQVPETFLFVRGNIDQPKEKLAPGELTVLASASTARIPENDPTLPTTGRRLAYARHLTDGSHPLTARVFVNRIWLHHFGRGIVSTPADFGIQGERPTHPKLLDWLASEFVEAGWRIKSLHRWIMLSTAYRQSSRVDLVSRRLDCESKDPDNILYWRKPLIRLEAEAVRDSVLAINGQLDNRMFGVPVGVKRTSEGEFILDAPETSADQFRRSVYVQVRRSQPLSVLAAFDSPRMEPNCEARTHSTVTPQALLFMNSPFIVEQADLFSRHLRAEHPHDVDAQIKSACLLTFGEAPDDQEIRASRDFLVAQIEHYRKALEEEVRKKAESKDDKKVGWTQVPPGKAIFWHGDVFEHFGDLVGPENVVQLRDVSAHVRASPSGAFAPASIEWDFFVLSESPTRHCEDDAISATLFDRFAMADFNDWRGGPARWSTSGNGDTVTQTSAGGDDENKTLATVKPIDLTVHRYYSVRGVKTGSQTIETLFGISIKGDAETSVRHFGDPFVGPIPGRQALATFCQALISANGFIYVD
jgi:mono/diheme cytochrome c family protein